MIKCLQIIPTAVDISGSQSALPQSITIFATCGPSSIGMRKRLQEIKILNNNGESLSWSGHFSSSSNSTLSGKITNYSLANPRKLIFWRFFQQIVTMMYAIDNTSIKRPVTFLNSIPRCRLMAVYFLSNSALFLKSIFKNKLFVSLRKHCIQAFITNPPHSRWIWLPRLLNRFKVSSQMFAVFYNQLL